MDNEFLRRIRTSTSQSVASDSTPSTSASSGPFSRPSTSSTTASSTHSNLYPPGHRRAESFSGSMSERMFGEAGPSSPRKSPNKDKLYGDRFIPTRDPTGMDLATSYQLMGDGGRPGNVTKGKRKLDKTDMDARKDEANRTFNALLKTEMFGPPAHLSHSTSLPTSLAAAAQLDGISTSSAGERRYTSSTSGHPIASHTPPGTPGSPGSAGSASKNLFSFSSPSRKRLALTAGAQGVDSPTSDRYGISPVRYESQQLLLSPRKTPRNLSKVPYKVLDAPDLADDFYLNLVDWSTSNNLGVGLGHCVYLWSAVTSKVTKLCDFAERHDPITSLAWMNRGPHIAIGTNSGAVEIWDSETQQFIRTMRGHTSRVGALSWNDAILTSGSRDKMMYHRDVRVPDQWIKKLAGHKQEVCGLKWSFDGKQLASGGNDNKLFVWDGLRSDAPLWKFNEHSAAVKAIAWNPHQQGILASGGGTADKKIRFWNTITGTMLSEVDTGSQICNLLFSTTSSELVSTHGFSAGAVQNQVCIWKYPSMQQVATLTGHTYRVLYLSASPDGRTIVTGAGDETLRFWDCFKAAPKNTSTNRSILDPLASIR